MRGVEFSGGAFRELVVRKPWAMGALREFRESGADSLVLDRSAGYSEPNLDFLKSLGLRRLRLEDRREADLEPVYSNGQTLESLDLEVAPSVELDLSRLPRLRELTARWSVITGTIRTADHIPVLGLRSAAEDAIAGVVALRAVRVLRIQYAPRIESLDSLGSMSTLEHVRVESAPRLVEIGGLSRLTRLVSLGFVRCHKLEGDLSALAPLDRLTSLALRDCGSFASLHPIAHLGSLERLDLRGVTQVLDGDLSVIAALPGLVEFRMRNREHYRPSVAEVQRVLRASLSAPRRTELAQMVRRLVDGEISRESASLWAAARWADDARDPVVQECMEALVLIDARHVHPAGVPMDYLYELEGLAGLLPRLLA